MILYGIPGICQSAVQASIALITEKQFLMQGNAVINMASTLEELPEPIIGGVLFGVFRIMSILFISVGCFVFSAVMEIFIHIRFEKISTAKAFWVQWALICRTALNSLKTKTDLSFGTGDTCAVQSYFVSNDVCGYSRNCGADFLWIFRFLSNIEKH